MVDNKKRVEINLLPWRDYKRAYQNKVMKKILLATLLFTMIILTILHQILSSRETALQIRIDVILNQIQQWREQSIRQNQKQSSQPLPKPPSDITTLFDELKKMNENEVCFTDISRKKNMTMFTGKAHSAADLTDYLQNWRAAYLFSHIKINQLKQKNNTAEFRFEAIGLIE
jgi:hypothetical protein